MGTKALLGGARATVVLAACSPALAHPLRCASGHTEYHRAGTRLFSVERHGRVLGTPYSYVDYFACGPGQRRPLRIYSGASNIATTLGGFRREGRFLAYTIRARVRGRDAVALIVGWFEPASRRYCSGPIGDSDHPGTSLFSVRALVVAHDGSIAVLDHAAGRRQRLAVLVRGRRGECFYPPKLVYAKDPGDVEPRSLSYARGVVSWTSTRGERRHVAVGRAGAAAPPAT